MATSNTNPPCPSDNAGGGTDAPMLRTLVLERGGHCWTVRWMPGDERTVMEWAIELVDQEMVGLSPGDARIVAEAIADAIHRYARHTTVAQGTD